MSLTKRLPGAVRAIAEVDAAPEPTPLDGVDALVERVRELRATGMDKATASQRALLELFAGGILK